MSIIGILSSNLFASGASGVTQNAQSAQGSPSNSRQLATEFQQLSQDLQSGNLTQAQQDYATISQQLPGAAAAGANSASSNPSLQAFAQLGQDLQAGKLQAAQQDYATLQQDAQQNVSQAAGHHRHHHHRAEGAESSNSSQQSNPVVQAFSTLAQDLQAGNLSGAQSAFATLQNDLQQIGGFLPGGPSGTSGSPSPSVSGTLSVTA